MARAQHAIQRASARVPELEEDIWLSPAFRDFDIRPDCRLITAPLLAVQGLNDEYGSLDQLRDIQAMVPGATTLELPDCGHSPHRDQPDLLTAAITRFLKPCA